jgi:ubiquinone/menaquinone biosynthesis C-methylase UbiE
VRGRESGMPILEQWESYFDADEVVRKLSQHGQRDKCVEFGCGYGTFTLSVAGLDDVQQIASFDIDDEMLKTTAQRLGERAIAKVTLGERDFLADGCGLPDSWADWGMIFNLLHIEASLDLLAEAHRVIRPGGTLAIMHWRRDIQTPRGPSMAIRPSRDQCQSWAEQAGFQFESAPTFERNPWHWGLKMSRPAKMK